MSVVKRRIFPESFQRQADVPEAPVTLAAFEQTRISRENPKQSRATPRLRAHSKLTGGGINLAFQTVRMG